MIVKTRALLQTSASKQAAAALRAAAFAERAHEVAQEGRSVPVLDTSPQLASALRQLRSALPDERARLCSARSQLQRVKSVTRNGKELIHLAGYATVFDTPYQMWDMWGPYDEDVRVGAADDTLAADPDVIFLENHKGLSMARTKSAAGMAATLELGADATGMADDAFVNPKRDDVARLLTAVDDGQVTEQSFAFMIDEARWSDDFTQFTIVKFDIDRGDVSAVNFGANPYTSISARAQELMGTLDLLPVGYARAAFDRLARRADVLAAAGGRPVEARAGGPTPVEAAQRDLDILYIDYDDEDGGDSAACASCGAANEADAQFCDQCGTAMPAGSGDPASMAAPAGDHRSAPVVATGRRITAIEAMLAREVD